MSKTQSTVLMKHHLEQLKLPPMLAECEKLAARAAKQNLGHLAYLLQLCVRELINREHRAAERRLNTAKFPMQKTLQSFDFNARPSLNRPMVLEMAWGDDPHRRGSILLVGPSGTGKSHLAIALGIAACKKVRCFRLTELIAANSAR